MNILNSLIAFTNADDDDKREIGEQIRGVWESKYGAVGMIHTIRRGLKESRDLSSEKQHAGDSFQVMRFYACEDIFLDGKPSHIQQVIAVGRMVDRTGGYGVWFELQEDGNVTQKVDEEKWYEITPVFETLYTLAGTLYFELLIEEGLRDKAKGPQDEDVVDAKEVDQCFNKIGEIIEEKVKSKTSYVIALSGVCGCGKSTELARIIHKHVPNVTRLIVEPRRKVAINNAIWMHKGKKKHHLSEWLASGNDENNFLWPEEYDAYASLVDLHVGVTYASKPTEMVVVDKMAVRKEILRRKSHPDDADGRTVYCTTGTLINIATSVARLQSKNKCPPIVLIVSDWEDRTMEIAQCLIDFKNMCKKLNCTYVIIMASQAYLDDPWLSWVIDKAKVFGRMFAPSSLAEYYKNPERTFCSKRFFLHQPSSHNALQVWEEQLFKLTISQCWRLLRIGGCIIVKVVGKSHCFRMARKFNVYQDLLIRDGVLPVDEKIESLPFCSSLLPLKQIGKIRGVLFSTDIIMYGHNLPSCRAVLSCGLRNILQYNKAFGLVVLNTMMISRDEFYQLCGRIDRLKVERGHAFTFISVTSKIRPKMNDLTVTYDDSFILSQLHDLIVTEGNMGKVHNIKSSDLAQFGVCSQMGYAFDLFKVNYCIPVEGPTNLGDMKMMMELLTTKMSPAPTRWKMILLQLWLLQMNKEDASREVVMDKFKQLVLKTLKYVAFTEEAYVWMYSMEEATWADQKRGVDSAHFRGIMEHYNEYKDKYSTSMSGYGGEGYQSMFFLDDIFSISTAPISSELRYNNFEGCGNWKQVMPQKLATQKLREVANLVGNFPLTVGAKGVLRSHFRLLTEDRWEYADDAKQIQLVLCNTRPLQVAKFVVEPCDKKKTQHVAKTIVTKQLVYFDDSRLRWNDEPYHGYQCRCVPGNKTRTRYIYFGVLAKTKTPTKLGDLFRVRETMAISHEIGCSLEEWFIKTGSHLGPKSVTMDITCEKNKSSGIRLDLIEEAFNNSFEEKE